MEDQAPKARESFYSQPTPGQSSYRSDHTDKIHTDWKYTANDMLSSSCDMLKLLCETEWIQPLLLRFTGALDTSPKEI